MRSLLSVASWVLSAWATWKVSDKLIPLLDGFNLEPVLQSIIASLILFFAVLLVATLLSAFLTRTFVIEALAGVDRILGAAFGIVRGAVIVLLLALVSSFAFVLEAPWWQHSIALSLLEPYVLALRELVSPYLAPGALTSPVADFSLMNFLVS